LRRLVRKDGIVEKVRMKRWKRMSVPTYRGTSAVPHSRGFGAILLDKCDECPLLDVGAQGRHE
jgi:hypothetical protein